jgi:hypothetical protein
MQLLLPWFVSHEPWHNLVARLILIFLSFQCKSDSGTYIFPAANVD